MESTKNILLYIENHGLSLIITVMLILAVWKYIVPYIKEQTEILEEVKKFLKNFNTGAISGKALGLMLELQAKSLRWSIENKYVFFIQNNNIKNRYNNIIFEIDNYISTKMLKFEDELKDITDKITFKVFFDMFQSSISDLKRIKYSIKGIKRREYRAVRLWYSNKNSKAAYGTFSKQLDKKNKRINRLSGIKSPAFFVKK